MPNCYASVADIRGGMPDGIRSSTTKYDALLLRLASEVSRAIDGWCNRVFYPTLATRYFYGSGARDLWVPDLLTITTVSYSEDDGETYTALTSADYLATVAGDVNGRPSYSLLRVSALSNTLSAWPAGERSVKIAGIWGYVDDRDLAWESTGDTSEDNPLTSGATAVTVNDVDGDDLYGAPPRFAAGQIIRMESEYCETTLAIEPGANTLGLLRGRNGTTAASHAQNTAIDLWRAPEPIRRACVVQANRELERGFQGFGDARATPELGSITYSRQWDPVALALMSPYRIRVTA